METKRIPWVEILSSELIFTTSRSGGPGGQNVNKVNTKVTLKFDVVNSDLLNGDQKELIKTKLATKLTKEGMLILSAQEKRSQLENKVAVLLKFDNMLIKAFTPRKARKATKPSKAAKRVRIQNKKIQSEKKQWRQKP